MKSNEAVNIDCSPGMARDLLPVHIIRTLTDISMYYGLYTLCRISPRIELTIVHLKLGHVYSLKTEAHLVRK